MANASFAYNDAKDYWDSPASYEDPTCGIPFIAGGVFSCPGRHIYAPEAGGSFATRLAESIASDYEAHCRAARSVAVECFDSDKVLGRLMEEIGVAP